ncbi:uncharacterized protein LOC128726411 [Anopheles nili]|uniref:uncharacterized protein LOC128726411 n=1 Tax=Anopheles nili TaxID=185578 RepID=UPI00237BEEB0|nr:uncharacterized protein LOC128726411 [Anopheles nili]
MSTTPDRHCASIKLKSPRTANSLENIASLRFKTAIASIVENHSKWIQAAEKGMVYCNSIKSIRKNMLQKSADVNIYPANLRNYCKQLYILTSIMDDILTNAESISTQLKSLQECFCDSDIIGCTWNCKQILSVVQIIVKSYRQELASRKYVVENIGHTQSLDQLMLFTINWKHKMDVEREREILIKMLMFELNLV